MAPLAKEDSLQVTTGQTRSDFPISPKLLTHTCQPANITEVSYKMKEYTSLVNSLFTYRTPYEAVVAKRYPGALFAVFDVHSLMTDIYNHPSQYLSTPANVTGTYYFCSPSNTNCTTSRLGLDHFMWYDELHPSEATDKVIAREFVNVVKGASKYAAYWP